MSTGPRSVVEALVASLNAHDGRASRALFAPDAVVTTASCLRTDLDGMDRIHASTLDAFPDLRLRVTRWVVGGDTVVTEEVMDGTHRGEIGGFEPIGRRAPRPPESRSGRQGVQQGLDDAGLGDGRGHLAEAEGRALEVRGRRPRLGEEGDQVGRAPAQGDGALEEGGVPGAALGQAEHLGPPDSYLAVAQPGEAHRRRPPTAPQRARVHDAPNADAA